MTRRSDPEQKHAEQKVDDFRSALGPFVVAAEETRMPMLFTNANEPSHPIVFANDSFLALLGYGREEVLGQTFGFLLAESFAPAAVARIEASFECLTPAPMEVELRRKDGANFLAAIYVSPVRDEHGKVVQHFASFVDLTSCLEHKRALERVLSLQTELIHVSRVSAMGTMATTLAHELNQPLTAISNHAASCRLRLPPDAPHAAAIASDLTAIEKSALRAGAVIRRLREMTQHGSVRRERFDLNDAVHESVELVRVGSPECGSIEEKTAGAIMVEADRVQIQQVIINLAKNGCEAAAGHGEGRVTVTTRVDGDRAVVGVRDSGPGVTPEAAAGLFEWAASDKLNGMGVGLSVSRTIVEAHQGSIWLEASDAGRTQFCFSVPLSTDASASPQGNGRN